VTFCYALFTFLWMVVSPWRWKLVLYVFLVGLGMYAMPGPTLLLMLLMILPYMLFLASRRSGRLDVGRLLMVACIAAIFAGAFFVLAKLMFPLRLDEVLSGNDPSFFYRVHGPALAGIDIIGRYSFAGAGLTGEPFVEREITNLYLRSPFYSAHWQVVTPATELVINYFWLHWIYLGLVWGLIIAAAVTFWLRVLGVPSPAGWSGRSWGKRRAPMSGRPAGRSCFLPAPPRCCISERSPSEKDTAFGRRLCCTDRAFGRRA
jgi:hypothetical protein